jgi:hypothetical protein
MQILVGAEEELQDSAVGQIDDDQNTGSFDESTNYEEDAQLLRGQDKVGAIMQSIDSIKMEIRKLLK